MSAVSNNLFFFFSEGREDKHVQTRKPNYQVVPAFCLIDREVSTFRLDQSELRILNFPKCDILSTLLFGANLLQMSVKLTFLFWIYFAMILWL
jgi:hypothetical protein